MAPFDPYFKWLAIPPEEQPPHHYRLLGLPIFVDDLDVIEGAAERQTVYLRSFQTGPNSELAERLLNEVSAARVCLLDGKSKARYDTQLRTAQQPTPEEDPLAFTTEELAAVSSKPATRSRPRGGKPFWQQPWAIPVGAAGIVVVLLLIMLIFGSGEEAKESGQGLEQELQAEIASLKEKLVAAGNSKVVPTASEVTAKSLPTGRETLPAKVAVAPPLAAAPFDAAQAKAHQQAWSKHLGVPVEYTNSIGMKFMLIPPGEFMMGAPETDTDAHDDEKPQVPVRISRPFYLGKYEVANREFKELLPEHKSAFDGSELPVSMVNYVDCTMYCFRLRHRDMKQYRLPTEAEWEYACRAGTTTRFSFGDSMQELNNHSWNGSNSGMKAHAVGQKIPNAWGMFDMHGNVWEMCHDGGRHNYVELSALERIQDPIAYLGSERPLKGGGFGRWPTTYLRSSKRGKEDATKTPSFNYVGFRVVLEIPVRAQPNTIAAVTKSLPPNLKQGLVAYYPFNGNANDESGNGHHGEVQGAVLDSDRHGNTDQAYRFDGKDDFILVSDHNDLNLGNADGKKMTISLWFKGPVKEKSIHFIRKTGKGGTDSRHKDYVLYNAVRKGIVWGTGPSSRYGGDDKNSTMLTGVIPTAGLWHHLVAKYNHNEGGGKEVFLDGALIHQGSIGKKTESNDQPLHIGPAPGSIDDIRIYNRALSAEEVKALYEFEKP